MIVSIVGAGRMGSALAYRSVKNGFVTQVICRDFKSPTIRPLPDEVALKKIDDVTRLDCDIILIAAPAFRDPEKEADILRLLRRTPKQTPVVSLAAYQGAPNSEWADGRLFARMMCSPAIAQADYAPLILLDSPEDGIIDRLQNWVGSSEIVSLSARKFDDQSLLFFTVPLMCEVLVRLKEMIERDLDDSDHIINSQMFSEAHALLKLCDLRPEKAVDLCATPNGLTRSAIDAIFQNSSKLQQVFDSR